MPDLNRKHRKIVPADSLYAEGPSRASLFVKSAVMSTSYDDQPLYDMQNCELNCSGIESNRL